VRAAGLGQTSPDPLERLKVGSDDRCVKEGCERASDGRGALSAPRRPDVDSGWLLRLSRHAVGSIGTRCRLEGGCCGAWPMESNGVPSSQLPTGWRARTADV